MSLALFFLIILRLLLFLVNVRTNIIVKLTTIVLTWKNFTSLQLLVGYRTFLNKVKGVHYCFWSRTHINKNIRVRVLLVAYHLDLLLLSQITNVIFISIFCAIFFWESIDITAFTLVTTVRTHFVYFVLLKWVLFR